MASLVSLSPTHGHTSGGFTVTLTGTGFTGTTSVKFGTVTASNLNVVSNTSITVTAPAVAESYNDVTVFNPGGNSTLVNSFVFHDWSQVTVSDEIPLLLDGQYNGASITPLVLDSVLAGAAPTIVDNVGNPAPLTGSSLTLTMTTSHNVVAGNSIIVALAINGGPAITITDSVGNSYSLDNTIETGVTTSTYIYSAHNVTHLPSASTIVATFDTARTSGTMQAYDASNLSGAIEDVAAGTAASATSLTQGTLQTTHGNALIFGAFGITSNNTTQTFTAASGYTALAYSRGGSGSSSRDLFTEWKSLPTYGYQMASATVNIAHAYAAVTVAYKAKYPGFGSGGVGPAPTPQTRNVSTAAQLTTALNEANAGDTIVLAGNTTYTGSFTIPSRRGTALAPITLTGPSTAIIDGNAGTGYCLYLYRCAYWHITGGLTLQNNLKGLVMDISDHCNIDGITIKNIKQECLHVRNDSCDNVVQNCTISDSGTQDPGFGEAMYVGSAYSNWGTPSVPKSRIPAAQVGFPDKSDRNSFLNNTTFRITAEALDIKEGTTGTIVSGNNFDGALTLGANDAVQWVDIKGQGCTISNNVGTTIMTNGYSTENPTIPEEFRSDYYDGYGVLQPGLKLGCDNVFSNNTSNCGSATGYAIEIKFPENTGNVVYANNTQTGAAQGLTNIAVTP